jgi:hypothetical protein
LFIERLTTICHDTLHLFIGLLIWIAAASLLRRSLRSWVPLLVVFALAVFNEAVDLTVELWPNPGMQLGEGAKDVLTTIAVPVTLFVAMKLHPRLVGAGRS